MSVEAIRPPSSLFGSEIDPADADWYATLDEKSGRKSSLSFHEDFADEENIDTKFKSFIKKEAIILKNLGSNMFDFSDPDNILNKYYETPIDINALWPLLKGNKINSLVVHHTRDFFNELPCRFNFKDIKYQLDKSLINNNKFTPKPDKYYQNIPDYYKWIKNFCDKNCDVFPYKLNDQQIIFLPIISPLWFINGKIFKSVENYGYINPNLEYCVDWLSDWLSKYNLDIKEKYIRANKLFLEKKSFIEPEQFEDYKEKLISSVFTNIQHNKFINRFKDDSSFRKLHKKYFESIINFSENIRDSDLSKYEIFLEVIEKYIVITNYEIKY